ncbi:MAG: hypothetical protein ACLFU8_18140 [Anaerolineales bacterium]
MTRSRVVSLGLLLALFLPGTGLPVRSATPADAGPTLQPPAVALTPDPFAAQGATLEVTWSTGEGCETPPEAAVTTLEQAAGLWGTWISSTVLIEAEACWTSNISIPGAAGTGRPTTYVWNPPGAPLLNTSYPIALANALSGVKGDGPEIMLEFNANQDLSLATALHELAHGLGFVGLMTVEDNIGCCGDSSDSYWCPSPYDRFVIDSDGVLLLDLQTPDPRVLADRLTRDANFGGPNTKAANGGTAAKLYTPSNWSSYSSLSHLDQDTFQSTENALMTPSAAGSHPGPVGLAILQDMGWLRVDGAPNVVTSGPQILGAGQATPFDGELVWSGYADQSITYTWTADDQSPITHTGTTTTDSVTFTWTTPGRRRIILTATDGTATTFTTRDALVYAVSVGGPVQADTGEAATFTASVTPEVWTYPITYTWEASGLPAVTHIGSHEFDDSATFTWRSAGSKTITVTADIGAMAIQAVHAIEIEEWVLDNYIYVPLVVREGRE